jgi:choline-sulfatase
MCERVDALIGRILGCLRETGLAEKTLVIYCTDHGEMAGDHDCWWKSNYYEGSVGVPLIARLPGIVPAGSTSDAVCNLMDLGPTLAELVGGEMTDVDGASLWSTMQGRPPRNWSNETFSEFCDRVGSLFLPSRMIRSGKWKLWVYPDQEELPPALFNMEEDPFEQNDLGQAPRFKEVRRRLLEKVSSNWDPQQVQEGGRRAVSDWETLTRWAQRTLPANPDALEIPPPSLEEDVELL